MNTIGTNGWYNTSIGHRRLQQAIAMKNSDDARKQIVFFCVLRTAGDLAHWELHATVTVQRLTKKENTARAHETVEPQSPNPDWSVNGKCYYAINYIHTESPGTCQCMTHIYRLHEMIRPKKTPLNNS